MEVLMCLRHPRLMGRPDEKRPVSPSHRLATVGTPCQVPPEKGSSV